jgi:hypothetical protein
MSEVTRPPLPRCAHPGCEGHLSKFSSCLDEWLFECSMEGSSETFGDTDWHGHYAIVEVSADPSWASPPEDFGGHAIVPATGVYVVLTHPSGVVDVWRYDTTAECETDMSDIRAAYEAWIAEEEESR